MLRLQDSCFGPPDPDNLKKARRKSEGGNNTIQKGHKRHKRDD